MMSRFHCCRACDLLPMCAQIVMLFLMLKNVGSDDADRGDGGGHVAWVNAYLPDSWPALIASCSFVLSTDATLT